MKAGARALSASGRSLSTELQAIIRQYESRLGRVPAWMRDELPPLRTAALLESAVRIGVPYCEQDLDLIAQNNGG